MSGKPTDLAVTVRLRLDISYDGTDFHGWAVQPGRRTVAGVLGGALATLFRTPVPMVVAGRTDAGVHASGQVAHIDVDPGALAGLAPRHLAVPRPESGSVVPAPDLAEPAGSPQPHPDRVHKDPLRGQWRTESGDAGSATGITGAAAGLVGLRRRLAGLLPADLRIRAVRIAPDGFDARFSALRRRYRYRVASSEWGADPLRRTDTLAWRRPLDVAAMQSAANLLTGLRDFAAYCKPREGATTIRDLQLLTVTARPVRSGDHAEPVPTRRFRPGGDAVVDSAHPARSGGDGDADSARPARSGGDANADSACPGDGGIVDDAMLVLIHVTADAFCHSMVRSLVGALLAVGDGRTPVHRPAELLAAGRRTAQIAVAPAHGLTLIGVDYPPDAELATRADRTRAIRTAVPPDAPQLDPNARPEGG